MSYPIIMTGNPVPSPLILLSPNIATPHSHSTILSGYLKDKSAGGERALAEINVHDVANHTSIYSAHEQEPNPPD
jgi:hypothetical protein